MTEKRNKPISRREALKAIGAVTGVTVLSVARGDWETPLVQVGALPAHAQGSGGTLRVNNITDGTIRVLTTAAASMKAANGVCEGTEIPEGQTDFHLAPGSYTVKACIDSENCSTTPFPSSWPATIIVEGQITEVTFECPPVE